LKQPPKLGPEPKAGDPPFNADKDIARCQV
jgi:hypothetical protein